MRRSPVYSLLHILKSACLMALLMCLFTADAAQALEDFVEPTLAEGAPEWDASLPQNLDPDMLICHSAILIEASTGNVIFEKNADEIMYPASTTKIMTALLALQWGDLEETVYVSYNAANSITDKDATMVPVSEEEEVPLRNLITATMVRSGNDGAIAIAEHIGGSEQQFAEMMNETAYFLGCTNTHFVNAHGLHDPSHVSTARDLAIIAQSAMQNEDFRDIVKTVNYTMPKTNKHPERNMITGNYLLRGDEENPRWYYPEAIGIKTGSHSQAGWCLVAGARREGVELISVVLYSAVRGRWQDSIRLFEYGFSQYDSIDPITIYNEDPRVINITGFETESEQMLSTTASDDDETTGLGRLLLEIRPADEDREVYMVGTLDEIETYRRDFNIISHVNWTREHRAPIEQGDVMGILTFYPRDEEPAEYELVASRSIAARSDAPPSIEEIERYTREDSNPLPRFSIEFIIPPLGLLLLLFLFIRWIRSKRKRVKRAERKLPTPKRRHYQ